MQKLTVSLLDGGLRQYAFAPKRPAHWGTNIFSLQDGDRVALIDSGYAEHGKRLAGEFRRHNLRIDTVILSHFHDDHMEGVPWLKPARLVGHAGYPETLRKWTPEDERRRYVPTDPVPSPTRWEFGSHTLELTPLLGHSESDLLIRVDQTFLHIGDLILQSPRGDPILPAVEPPLLESHMRALDELRARSDCIFLLSHGPVLRDPGIRRREIDDRLRYLDALRTHPSGISYAEATGSCRQCYLHKEWHDEYFK